MAIKLVRNRTLTIERWIDENEFVGVIESPRGTYAAYGWANPDASFYVYEVFHGHIERLGRIKRAALDTAPADVLE